MAARRMAAQATRPAQREETAVLRFDGQLREASFLEFAQHRAGRLSLGLAVLALSPGSARLAVSGPPDLVDAFEMALSLGPGDCLVLEVVRETNEQGRQ